MGVGQSRSLTHSKRHKTWKTGSVIWLRAGEDRRVAQDDEKRPHSSLHYRTPVECAMQASSFLRNWTGARGLKRGALAAEPPYRYLRGERKWRKSLLGLKMGGRSICNVAVCRTQLRRVERLLSGERQHGNTRQRVWHDWQHLRASQPYYPAQTASIFLSRRRGALNLGAFPVTLRVTTNRREKVGMSTSSSPRAQRRQ